MFEAGELLTARRLAEEAMEVARRSRMDTHPGLFDAVLTLGGLALEADQLEQAEDLIEEALRRCERARPPFEVMALVEQASLFSARCEPGDALSNLTRARGVLPAGPTSPLCSRIDVLEARVRIELRDLEGAVELGHTLSSPHRRILVEASAWLASGQPGRAQTCLSNLDAELDGRLAIEICLLRAGIRQHLGLDYHAELQRAVELGRPQFFVRSLLAVQPQLTDGIVGHLAHLPRDPYTDALLAAAERMEVRQAAASFVPREGALSEREQGVLHYLATRLTTREIADELYISMNTLKSHLKSIYRKLDATSRTDAVTHARGMGIL